MKRINLVLGAAVLGFAVTGNPAWADKKACTPGMYTLPADLSGWATPAVMTAARTPQDLSQSQIEAGKAVRLQLAPTPDLQFVLRPNEPGGSVSSAGMVGFAVAKKRTYRVMLGGRAWIDVVQNGHAVDSTAHHHGPECSGIGKMVDFTLDEGTAVLQLSGSGKKELTVMLVSVP